MEMNEQVLKAVVKNAVREAMAKNVSQRVNVFYVKGGINKNKQFDNWDEAEKFVKQNGLKEVRDPENENEFQYESA